MSVGAVAAGGGDVGGADYASQADRDVAQGRHEAGSVSGVLDRPVTSGQSGQHRWEGFILQDTVACGERAVGRAHMTGTSDGQTQNFAVATFITARDGLISDITGVWTDIGATPPDGTGPS